MKNQRYKKNTYEQKIGIYTERFITPHGGAASIASGRGQKGVIEAEMCICEDPHKCNCRMLNPPVWRYPWCMEERLFRSPQPMLLWTIHKIKYPDCRFMFVAKLEIEVIEEVNRRNSLSRTDIWTYYDEEEYNMRVLADYRLLQDKIRYVD